MNEAELVAGTIDTIKTRGWTTSHLLDESTGKHCILGAIGYARWGNNWDVDCHDEGDSDEMYKRLLADPVTRSVIQKIGDIIVAQDPDYTPNDCDGQGVGFADAYDHAYLASLVYGWNDDQLQPEGTKEVLEVLEKAQAEIGVDCEG